MHIGKQKLSVEAFEQKGYTVVGKEYAIDFGDQLMADGRPREIKHTTIEKLLYVGGEQVSFEDNPFDHQYNDWLRFILENGEQRVDRTKIGTMSAFGDVNLKFDLRQNFPAITGKRLMFLTMKKETIRWMLEGKCDLKSLKEMNVNIWDGNVKPGTEVYEGPELSLSQRLEMCTKEQRASVEDFMVGGAMTTDEKSVHERDYDNLPETYTFAINAKLNNWGVPENALSDGYLGPLYGKQWCAWEDIRFIPASELYDNAWEKYGSRGFSHTGFENGRGHVAIRREIDQIKLVEEAIKNEVLFHQGKIDKHIAGRRIILTGWNVAQLDEMQLPPCHTLAQWNVSSVTDSEGKHFLDCKLFMRSNDIFLGMPFNVAQYAMLTEMLAHAHGLTARFFHVTEGDAHIYLNHMDAVAKQLQRPIIHKAPKLKINCGPVDSIRDIKVEDIELVGYESYDTIKAPIAGN
jgi:thymidylate synthase